MKITRLKISNYRGVEALDVAVPPAGMTVKGQNGGGKTSIVKAIAAALKAQDVGADAIRIGADKAEILVDMDDVAVRRLISKSGSTVTVTGPKGKIASPQKWLNELVGGSGLDPIALFSDKPKERTKRILEALPIRVTRADVEGMPGLMESDLEGVDFENDHALMVCAKLHKLVYDRRTAQNQKLKELSAALDANPHQPVPSAKAVADAQAALDKANEKQRELEKQRAREEGAREARARAVTRIDELREKLQAHADPEDEIARLQAAGEQLESELAEMRAALKAKEAERDQVASTLGTLNRRRVDYSNMKQNLAEAEASLGEEQSTVTEEDLTRAEEVVHFAEQELMGAREAEALRETNAKRATVEKEHRELGNLTGQMTATVDRLRNELPTKLLASSNGIPGLTVDGDDVLVDGVSLDGLSGREQLMFAVEIARRANSKCKILVVDKLEAVQPSLLPEFVKAATADGFQLIATRVDDGDIVLETIEADEAKE